MVYFLSIRSKESLQGPNDERKQKHRNGNLVDPMHHPQVEIGFGIRIWFLKHPNKVIAHFSQLEEFFDLVFFCHGALNLEDQQLEYKISLFF
jgi:hypothetical protein